MIKNFILLLITIVLVGCSGSRPVAHKSKPNYRKPNTSVSARKPLAKKPIAKSNGQKKPFSKNSVVTAPETEVLQATTRVKVTTEIVLDYISTYKATAQRNMATHGIPASIILAQGILESGAGTGSLSRLANNHFGIKCHTGWTGESVKHDDDSDQECFRKYSNPAESYSDHSMFLTTRSRYASLFEYDRDDYKKWAKGLRAAGYATDPKYPEKLITLIERYQLDQYDAEVLGKNYTPTIKSVAVAGGPGHYQVSAGDTLYSISKRFNITVDELKRKNNIQDNVISIGQYIKVQ